MAFGLSAGAATLIGAVAAPVVGGLINGGAASNAAGIQAGAAEQANGFATQQANRANAMLQAQIAQTRQDTSGFLRNGTSASDKLALLLGLGSQAGPGSAAYAKALQANRARAIAQGADPTDPNFEKNLNMEVMSGVNRDDLGGAQDPNYGSLNKAFTGADLENEPGYKFGLQQGQQAIDNRFASGGKYFSGEALKGATKYTQDYAGTKYGEAFNRDASQKNQTYNFLSGMAGQGLNAASINANVGSGMANSQAGSANALGQTVGANTTALGNAVGASEIAQGNALSGGLQGAYGNYQQNQLTQAILGGNRGFGSQGGWQGGGRTVPTYPGAEY